jgi:HAD superfamily hydrolase (TIGR01509 family)
MRATLFDFNGVLVDDEGVHLAAFREVLRAAHPSVVVSDADYVDRYMGYDDAGAFRAILSDAGHAASEDEIARLIEAKKPAYMRRARSDLKAFPGAREILERRATLGPVGIVSGALRHEIEHALEVLGARASVGFVVSAEDAPRCKPDPQGYLLGLARLPEEARAGAVVVEDSLAGVRAAKAAGLRCVAVTHSYDEARLRDAGADVVASCLADLTDPLLG